LKVKQLAFLLLSVLAVAFMVQIAAADTANYVTGSISASSSEVITHSSVTITCTYTSTSSATGTGKLWIAGPVDDPTDTEGFDGSSSVLQYYDGGTKVNHSPTLTSGVPVSYIKTLDTTGYYKFKWECQGGGVVGAFVEVTVHVVDTPTVLPEAPPLAVFALGFAALGLFVAVTKKRSIQ
jgi:hypothetical protein